jgi:hypothetical protein
MYSITFFQGKTYVATACLLARVSSTPLLMNNVVSTHFKQETKPIANLILTLCLLG